MAYRAYRGHDYSSHHHGYDPLRGHNQQNNDPYSSLRYTSHSRVNNNHHNHNHSHPHSHPYSSHAAHPNHPNFAIPSLHRNTVSNQQNGIFNPFTQRTINGHSTTNNLPDLSAPRPPPQPLSTPKKSAKPQDSSANGWSFKPFMGFFKNTWNKLRGTPSKPTRPRQSLSQPPPPPLTPPREEPANPYSITNTALPSLIDADHEQKQNEPDNDRLRRSDSVQTVPVTPPNRPNIPAVYPSNTTDTRTVDDDQKSQHTQNTHDSSTVIQIHNLLKKANLSPDDAAWLHCKLDAVTRDRDGGSLSYIGPIPRSRRDGDPDDGRNGMLLHSTNRAGSSQTFIGGKLHFDDAATERSSNSPLLISKKNAIPSSAVRAPRYDPHPGNYHIHSSSRTNQQSLGQSSKQRKRRRMDVFMDDEENNGNKQQPKRRKIANSIGLKRTGNSFRTNQLRPREDVVRHRRPQKYMTPQFQYRQKSKINKQFGSTQKIKPFDISQVIQEHDNEDKQDKNDEDKSNKNDKTKIVSQHILDANPDKKPSEAEKNGFCFGSNTDSIINNNVVIEDDNRNLQDLKAANNGFGMGLAKISATSSEETSENNVSMDTDNKPLPRRTRKKKKGRSPLKDRTICSDANTKKNISKMNENEEDEDEDVMKKDKDDSNSPLKKPQDVTPQKSKPTTTTKMTSPQCIAFENTSKLLKDDKISSQKQTDVITLDNIATDKSNEEQKTDVIEPMQVQTKEQKKTDLITETPSNDTNDNMVNNEAAKTEDVSKVDSKPTVIPQEEPYYAKIMRQNKERYLKVYRNRFERIYKEHNKSKLNMIETWIKKHGSDPEKLHEIYDRVCKKYKLRPFDLYEGQEHEPQPAKDEKEKLVQDTPDDSTTKLEDKKEESFKFNMGQNDDTKQPQNGFTVDNKPEQQSTAAFSWGVPNANNNDSKVNQVDVDKKDDKKANAGSGWTFGADNDNAKGNGTTFSWEPTATTTTTTTTKMADNDKTVKSNTDSIFGTGTSGFNFTQPTKDKPEDKAKKVEKTKDEQTASWDFSNFGKDNGLKQKKTENVSFATTNIKSPFGNTETKKEEDKNGGFSWSLPSNGNGQKKPEQKTESASTNDPFNGPPIQFSIPNGISFTEHTKHDQQVNDNKSTQKGNQNVFGTASNGNSWGMSGSKNNGFGDAKNNGFANTNKEFQFGVGTTSNHKPSLTPTGTEIMDNTQTDANKTWSFGASNNDTAKSAFSWGINKNNETEQNKQNGGNHTFSFNGNTDHNKENDQKQNGHGNGWNINNNTNGHNQNGNNNNNSNGWPAWNKNTANNGDKSENKGSNSSFSWGSSSGNGFANNNGAKGNETADKNTNNGGAFSWNPSNVNTANAQQNNNNNGNGNSNGFGWGTTNNQSSSSSAFGGNNNSSFLTPQKLPSNNNNNQSAFGVSPFSWDKGNNGNGSNMNNNNNNNPQTQQTQNSSSYQFQPNGNGNIDNNNFFPSNKGKSKRKIYRAKRSRR